MHTDLGYMLNCPCGFELTLYFIQLQLLCEPFENNSHPTWHSVCSESFLCEFPENVALPYIILLHSHNMTTEIRKLVLKQSCTLPLASFKFCLLPQ